MNESKTIAYIFQKQKRKEIEEIKEIEKNYIQLTSQLAVSNQNDQ